MAQRSGQAIALALLGLGSTPAFAETAGASLVWPWVSLLLLLLLLGAAIAFCFWLQKQISRLQQRLGGHVLQEAELQKRLDEMIAEEQFRTTFFHNTSHELRTPLNGIIGFLQLTVQGQYGTLPQPVRVQISKCLMLAESLKHQIATILDMTDGRRGKLQLQNSRINLSQLLVEIETIAESMRLRYPDCQFESKKAWPNDDGTFIHDSNKILMILRNLVSNAFKFGKPQQRNHVVVALTKRNRALTIEVSDQGLGLSSEQISRIFEDQSEGSEFRGMGLAVIRLLLRLMNGEMKISSEPGAGSKFTIVIPEQSALHLEALPVEYVPQANKPLPEESFTRNREALPSHNLMKMDGYAAHVLVVDDNEINCEIIQEILIPQGYRVSLAYGGREALTRMRADRPDLILLDLAMPEFSGEDVMQEKQLDNALADIPVILITARASEEDRIHGLDLGADDYLTKPIIHQELVLRVRNLLARQRLTKRLALMEEREKLAQLGELITDLSREIKEIYADRHGPEASRVLCQKAIEALPEVARFGPHFSGIFLEDQESSEEMIDLDALPLPKGEHQNLGLLRSMRLQLAPAGMELPEKVRIWQAIQALTGEDLVLFASVTALASAHRDLMDQSQKSRQLMDGILEFHQRRSTQKICRVDQTLTKTAHLLGPRLRLTGVRLTMDVPNLTLTIHPADLMQVCISLITTLCHRLEMLLDQDKWLKIEARVTEDQVLLRFTCGGPKFTESQALRLFDPVSDGGDSGGSGSGLHVARRIVQRAPGRLDFNLEEKTSCFELELPKTLPGIA